MKNLIKAVISVMSEVKGIEKSMTVGTGNSSYKGVPDKEVKKVIGESMIKNGLCILPIGVTANTKIERWQEDGGYGLKQKQQVLSEVTTKYLLFHESGESIELAGYGHGTDSQDKAAGKATTYALKYTLLYTFLIPTGKIDDADSTHSDNYSIPQKQSLPPAKQATETISPETRDSIMKLLGTSTLKVAERAKIVESLNNGLSDERIEKCIEYIKSNQK